MQRLQVRLRSARQLFWQWAGLLLQEMEVIEEAHLCGSFNILDWNLELPKSLCVEVKVSELRVLILQRFVYLIRRRLLM